MSNGNGSSKKWNVMLGIVTVTVILAFCANQGMWFYIALSYPDGKSIDAAVLAILNQGSGSVGAFTGAVIGYWVGSSKSSADKDDTAKEALKGVTDAVNVAGQTALATADTVNKMAGTGSGNTASGDASKVTTTTETKVTPAPEPESKKAKK